MSMWLRQSTASQEILLGPFLNSTDGNTAETGLTIANTDIKLWKEGATTEADKNSGGATHIAGGRYYSVLDATDTNTLGKLEVSVHVAGALYVRREFMVVPAMVYDSLILGTDRFDVNLTHIADALQTARDIGASVLVAVGTGAGEINVASGKVPATIAAGDLANDSITAAAIATGAIDADAIAADAATEIATAVAAPSASTIASAVWGFVIENSKSATAFMRLMYAALCNKSALSGTTRTYRDDADTKDRITATTDTSGQRTAVTKDAS